MNAYNLVIALSCVIIFSHIFNVFSKRTNVPSVILLILLGIAAKFALDMWSGINIENYSKSTIEVIGIVGLIMIVLEGAIDLELTKEKWPTIWKSFTIALLSLVACAFIISFIINQYYREEPMISLVYAVPLSIMSSAIVIPSVGRLLSVKKEFMIYESTFSDILGIMFFYFLKDNIGSSANTVVFAITGNIIITIVVSFVVSYVLVMLFQRITGELKFFLLIAVLVLLYAVGKQFHLSSLVIILVFGLVINNSDLFFFGKLKELVDQKVVDDILKNLHLVTRESAFVVRTFFFVIFGSTLDLGGLVDLELWGIGLLIVGVFFGVRYVFLKMFYWKSSILPELLITPRGLITVLLFFSIPPELESKTFNQDIILVTIIATSLIMTWGLVRYGKPAKEQAAGDGEPKVRGGGEIPYFVTRMSGEKRRDKESKAIEEPEGVPLLDEDDAVHPGDSIDLTDEIVEEEIDADRTEPGDDDAEEDEEDSTRKLI